MSAASTKRAAAGRGGRLSEAFWLACLVALSVAALAVAYGLQHLGGLRPCSLCLWERYPYWGVAALGGLALVLKRPALGLVAASLLLIGQTALAGYHVGVEQGWFALPTGCVAGGDATSVEELRAQLANARPPCDQPTPPFLGLSLAAWNLVLAATMTLATLAFVVTKFSAYKRG